MGLEGKRREIERTGVLEYHSEGIKVYLLLNKGWFIIASHNILESLHSEQQYNNSFEGAPPLLQSCRSANRQLRKTGKNRLKKNGMVHMVVPARIIS